MKFTKSKDGNSYASVQVIVRVSHDEVLGVKRYLKSKGLPSTDLDIKDFIRSCTETNYPSSIWPEETENHGD